MFHELKATFHPRIRIDFDVLRSPISCFVWNVPDSSQILVLSENPEQRHFHGLSTAQLRDILLYGKSEHVAYHDLEGITDPALRTCLAQLTQNVSACVLLCADNFLIHLF